MAIILEGFDGAGKSTLAEKLKFPVMHAGGPPNSYLELRECLSRQLHQCAERCVLDRVTAVSHQVYGGNMGDPRLDFYLKMMLKMPKTILVYCRPPDEVLMDFSKHLVKEHDTEEHLQDIQANMELYISRYDELMSKHTHVVYNYLQQGDDTSFINGLIYSQVKP